APTTYIYTLSLHDALPIFSVSRNNTSSAARKAAKVLASVPVMRGADAAHDRPSSIYGGRSRLPAAHPFPERAHTRFTVMRGAACRRVAQHVPPLTAA